MLYGLNLKDRGHRGSYTLAVTCYNCLQVSTVPNAGEVPVGDSALQLSLFSLFVVVLALC